MGKNIVVFSDGTGQEGGKGNNTNVYKLFNMVEDRTNRQVAFYDRGLGTGVRKITGQAAGMGISQNIRECYEFIFNNFQSGDRIYLFGFSRGATTVRSLSGLIDLFGVLPKSRPELIKQAYRIYRIRDRDKRKAKAEAFVSRHHSMWCNIEFLGVWDTVAALGVPSRTISVALDRMPFFRHRFHDLTLSSSVLHAYHALAIDDERKTFHPTVWTKKSDVKQTMKQVWFSGMHSDVGGGYPEQELSDVALNWMIHRAKKHGLQIYPGHRVDMNPDPDGVMHNSRGSFLGRCFRQKVRSWDSELLGKPVVHQSVFDRKLNTSNQATPLYSPWILAKDHDVEPWDH